MKSTPNSSDSFFFERYPINSLKGDFTAIARSNGKNSSKTQDLKKRINHQPLNESYFQNEREREILLDNQATLIEANGRPE